MTTLCKQCHEKRENDLGVFLELREPNVDDVCAVCGRIYTQVVYKRVPGPIPAREPVDGSMYWRQRTGMEKMEASIGNDDLS